MFSPMLAATETERLAGGLAGLSIVVILIALAIAIVWIIFPFIVFEKLNTMAKLQRETNRLLMAIAERTPEKPAGGASVLHQPPPKLPKSAVPSTKPGPYRID